MTHHSVSDLAPISEINTTPLIDVMLVLLIMFIITIPHQTHAVKLDLPSGRSTVEIHRPQNRIVVQTDGRIFWNGVSLSKRELSLQLAAVGNLAEQPEIHFQPEPMARYALVDEILAMTKRAEVRRLGFVGNEQYARF